MKSWTQWSRNLSCWLSRQRCSGYGLFMIGTVRSAFQTPPVPRPHKILTPMSLGQLFCIQKVSYSNGTHRISDTVLDKQPKENPLGKYSLLCEVHLVSVNIISYSNNCKLDLKFSRASLRSKISESWNKYMRRFPYGQEDYPCPMP